MDWIGCVKNTIEYMEQNLLTIKGPEEVAESVYTSTLYVQRGFQILTGYTIGEYLRNRRLYLAALEISNTDNKIIDISLKYGYETQESFTKAFSRFHGFTPNEVRKDSKKIKSFFPLQISLTVQGGINMNYVVKEEKPFKVIGFVKEFSFSDSSKQIPLFWDEIFAKYAANICAGKIPQNEIEQAFFDNHVGEYGVCIDDINKDSKFRYFIAGRYLGGSVPVGMEVYVIPGFLWAKFKSIGAIPAALQAVNTKIWKEWLPGNNEYEIAGNISVEWYSSDGNPRDDDYQSSVWIPVKRK